MVLATADAAGRPWASPVYYAPSSYREFFWVSSPDTTHSRNIRARPEVSIVVFDSSAPIGTGQGVYIAAVAEEPGHEEAAEGIAIFAGRSLAHGGPAWELADVRPPARLRLYRATAAAHFILDERDRRVPVEP